MFDERAYLAVAAVGAIAQAGVLVACTRGALFVHDVTISPGLYRDGAARSKRRLVLAPMRILLGLPTLFAGWLSGIATVGSIWQGGASTGTALLAAMSALWLVGGSALFTLDRRARDRRRVIAAVGLLALCVSLFGLLMVLVLFCGLSA